MSEGSELIAEMRLCETWSDLQQVASIAGQLEAADKIICTQHCRVVVI